MVTGCVSAAKKSPSILIPALDSANSGIMTNATQGCSAVSNRCSGDCNSWAVSSSSLRIALCPLDVWSSCPYAPERSNTRRRSRLRERNPSELTRTRMGIVDRNEDAGNGRVYAGVQERQPDGHSERLHTPKDAGYRDGRRPQAAQLGRSPRFPDSPTRCHPCRRRLLRSRPRCRR